MSNQLKQLTVWVNGSSGSFIQKQIAILSTIKNSIYVHRIEIRSSVIDLASTLKVHINMESQSAFVDRNNPTTKWSYQHQLATALSDNYPKEFNLPLPILINSDFYIGVFCDAYASDPTITVDLFYTVSNEKMVKRY